MANTIDTAQQKLIDAGLTNLKILKFSNMNGRSEILCETCGTKRETSVSSVLGHRVKDETSLGCPVCSRKAGGLKKRRTAAAEFEKIVQNSPGIIQLSPYIAAKKKVEMRHLMCGRTFSSTPDNLYANGERKRIMIACPLCGRDNSIGNQRSESDFVRMFEEKLGSRFSYVPGTYTKAHNEATFVCKSCHREFRREPARFMSQMSDCPYCSQHAHKDTERFANEVNEKFPGIYAVIGDYTNLKEKILIRHNKCGKEWAVRCDALIGRDVEYCPFCNAGSDAEKELVRRLDSIGFPYEYQKRFDWCKDEVIMPFDFYFPTLKTIVEIDGRQHSESMDFFGGEDKLNYTQFHDRLKERLAREHGIRVLRFDYLDRKVDEVVDKVMDEVVYVKQKGA